MTEVRISLGTLSAGTPVKIGFNIFASLIFSTASFILSVCFSPVTLDKKILSPFFGKLFSVNTHFSSVGKKPLGIQCKPIYLTASSILLTDTNLDV